MNKTTEKLLMNSEDIITDTLCLTFLEESERYTREMARSKDRAYRSLLSALRDGMAIKDLQKVLKKARTNAKWAAAGADTTNSPNRMYDEGYKCSIQTHLRVAA